jgi:hypothetical protein
MAFRLRRTPINVVEIEGKRIDHGKFNFHFSTTGTWLDSACLFRAITMVMFT